MPKKKATRKPATKRATTARKTTARKPAARKTTARKPAARKPAARKTTATKAPAAKLATSPIRAPLTKTQLFTEIAEATGCAKKEVAAVFDTFTNIVHRHVKKGGAQKFAFPGLLKIKVVRKPATKARKGINPFTGEPTVFKAKPARNVVKVQPLKNLKEMAS